jgi:hypothetical protein
MPKSIYFNSKTRDYFELSNFEGGVEFDYVARRFNSPNIKTLLMYLKTLRYQADTREFIRWLKLLQPEKVFSQTRVKYWLRGKLPIPGILAKLIGACYEVSSKTRRRIQAICDAMPGIHEDMFADSRVNTIEDMQDCLRTKFSSGHYQNILLSTGKITLHASPLRDSPGKWTYANGRGGDLLGKLLMTLRRELRDVVTEKMCGPAGEESPKKLNDEEFEIHLEIDKIRENNSGYVADVEEGSVSV